MSEQTNSEIALQKEARNSILSGTEALANAVKVTLGPKGKYAVLKQGANKLPVVTKDGVSVAKRITLADQYENMAVQLIRDAAQNTAVEAGDGTTTSTVLAHAILKEGYKNIIAGRDAVSIQTGIKAAVDALVAELQSMAKPCESANEVATVGTISANGDTEIGALLSNALEQVGMDGIITMQAANSHISSVDATIGMTFDRGFISPYFITDKEKNVCEIDNPYILITDKIITGIPDILPILEKTVPVKRPLFIIAEDISQEAITAIVQNNTRGVTKIVAARAPDYPPHRAKFLEDIAIVTGGILVSEANGHTFDSITLEQLGSADSITLTASTSTIKGGHGNKEDIEARIAELRNELSVCEDDFVYNKLKMRLAKLAGGVAVIKVGAVSDVELKERLDRVEDALHATRAAVEEGIVAGGGVALLRAREAVNVVMPTADQQLGADILLAAVDAPLRQIIANAGGESSVVLSKVLEDESLFYGYNAATGQYGNMLEMGVIDPVKVTRIALQNAASVACVLLNVGCMIGDSIK